MYCMHIPNYWTPEQAHAIIVTLESLAERLWCAYGDAIARDICPEPFDDFPQLELPFPPHPLDDDIPF